MGISGMGLCGGGWGGWSSSSSEAVEYALQRRSMYVLSPKTTASANRTSMGSFRRNEQVWCLGVYYLMGKH